jgi:hypothetical protein
LARRRSRPGNNRAQGVAAVIDIKTGLAYAGW